MGSRRSRTDAAFSRLKNNLASECAKISKKAEAIASDLRKNDYLCTRNVSHKYIAMCTITLEYNQNSALARRKLAALLATGLFQKKDVKPEEPTQEEIQAHRELREAVLEHSRRSMSPVIARYL